MAGDAETKKEDVKITDGVELASVQFKLEVPDLRNGAIGNIQQAAVRSGMSALYNWPIITGMASEQAVDAVEHIVRAHFALLMHHAGPTVTDAQATENRKWAIVLGGVRAGAAAAWRLGAVDLTRGELSTSGMVVSGKQVGQDAAGTSASALWTSARSMPDLKSVEWEIIAMCAYIGMAVPVLQGASLIATGHHYIPPTYNKFEGLKRQALGSATVDVKTWVDGMADRFNDLAFHKSCHPISPLLKRQMAKDSTVAAKLSASGHGSAAIRLPAIPSEATGGTAMLALIAVAAPVVKEMGHEISSDRGISLMLKLQTAKAGIEEADACDAVVKWVEDSAAELAFCAGIAQQLHDTSGMGKSSLLSAYSVRKLMASQGNQVSRGVTYARAAAARSRLAMEKGEYQLADIRL